MTRPRMVVFPARTSNPLALMPALEPFNWIIGTAVKLVWVVPSMVTGSLMEGRAVSGVIVYGFEPAIRKAIMSAPGLLLASIIACRNEPEPESVVFVTVKVAPDV